MAELSHSIKTGKGYSEKNIEGDESSVGKKGTSTLQQGGFMVPRYSKMEFPTYNGVGDPLGWLKRCEKFFGNQRTNEDDKDCCHVRFGPPMSNNPLGELANLKQTGTVEEYQSQFQSLLARIYDLKPRQQVDLFTAGLVEELRIDIEMQQPGNLGVAMNMARTLERYEGEQDNDEVDNLEVSLYAISGTRNSSTMQLIAKEIIWQGQLPEVVPRLSLMQGQNSPTIVLDKLLVEFAQLFQEPSGLPSNRGCDQD
ncbi:hypothetical protein V6N11_037588 [Hibiscus sabdariffa]|uniref:Uncharacterized protein n=2 Tax=Hibiscus sabdariffa TaxID=183260 RepID=A0ABR2BQ38_9ROSI